MPSRCLVADDDEDIREFIGLVLERAGHEVTLAGDGAQALSLAEAGGFDLVVLDHHMPRLTGLEVAGRLDGVRVLLMSGDLDVGARHRWFLPKPFNRTELVRAVDDLLRA